MDFWDPIRAVLTAGGAMEVDDATALMALEVTAAGAADDVDTPPRRVVTLDDRDVVATPPRRVEDLEGGDAVVDTPPRRVEDEEDLDGGVTREGRHLPLILSLKLQKRRSLAAGVGVGRVVVRPTPAYAERSAVNGIC